MVDDLLIKCEHEETSREIFFLIGVALQLKNGDNLPFLYLGPSVNFNDVNIKQSNTHISLSLKVLFIKVLLLNTEHDIHQPMDS